MVGAREGDPAIDGRRELITQVAVHAVRLVKGLREIASRPDTVPGRLFVPSGGRYTTSFGSAPRKWRHPRKAEMKIARVRMIEENVSE